MARPTKLTQAVEKTILRALRRGATRTAAFAAAGVHRSKISVYMRNFATFRDAVIQAEARAELRASRAVSAAIGDDWRAAAWWLERRRHDEWGRRDRVELLETVRHLAREHGLTPQEEDEAVAEAQRLLREYARE